MGEFLGETAGQGSPPGVSPRSAPSRNATGAAALRRSGAVAQPSPGWNPAPVRDFDPDAAAAPGSGVFGLPHGPDDAGVHVLPVPFHATTSYRRGAAHGPRAVLAASRQVDLFDLRFGRVWRPGIHMFPSDPQVEAWNEEATALAQALIADPELAGAAARIDAIGGALNEWVRDHTHATLAAGKLPALLGGDHSTSFGAIAACAARHPGLGILHFDAHADLRDAYEGFTWSHASILFNVLERLGDVARVVQVGVRDIGEEELRLIEASQGRVVTLFDPEWARARLAGGDLAELARGALERLPEEVYVTFDVDGLEPALCPNTGTPVPGGLTWAEAMLWLEELVASGRRVVGLDLTEVSPGPAGDPEGLGWDAIVGARLLYRLVGAALATRENGGGDPA